MTDLKQIVAERIQHHRKAKKITQEELGRRMGVGNTEIANFESGKRNITLDTLEQIAEALDVTVIQLLGA